MFGMGPWELFLTLLLSLIFILPGWKICSKMGYPGLICFLGFIPIINIIFIFYLAFTTWPIEKSDCP